MTNLHLSQMRAAPVHGRSRLGAWAGGLALALGLMVRAIPAVAQTPGNAPPAPPPRPAPTQVAAPRPPASLVPPSVAPPPAGRRPGTAATAAGAPSAARPALAPAPARPGVPPDSIRPKAAVTAAAPAGAVALCRDGTYLVPPSAVSDCSSHRGLQAAMPQRAAPPSAGAAQARVQATPSVALANAAPPAGATMRCKDGTYLSDRPSADACSGRGGLAAALPLAGAAPPQPRVPLQNPRSPGARAPQGARPSQSAASASQPPRPTQPASKAQPPKQETPTPKP